MLPGLVIRPVVHGQDDDTRADIYNRSCFDQPDFTPRAAADIARWNLGPEEKDQRRFIAEMDDRPVGLVANYLSAARADKAGSLLGPNVLPELRRRGVGRALAAAALDDLRARGARTAEAEVKLAGVADLFLVSLGFSLLRSAATMRRKLESLPPAGSTAGVEVSPLERDDATIAGYVALQNECFTDFPGYKAVSAETVRHMLASDSAEGVVRMVLAVQLAGVLVGSITAMYDPRSFERLDIRRGYLSDLGVADEKRGRGIGKALLIHALCWLREQDVTEAELTVDDFNVTVTHWYERLGFTAVGRELTYSLDLTHP